MRITFDHNCIIHLENGSDVAESIRAILNNPGHQCFVVNVGASEMQHFGVRPDNYAAFAALLKSIGIENLPRLDPIGIWGVTFYDRRKMTYKSPSLPTEEEFVASRRGKWSVAGIPHRGWTCVDIEDLGEPQIECQMCESQTIRYVHHMEHPDYPEVLEVGCVCAGHMEENLSASRAREASMKSRASKRKRWIARAWKVSVKENPYITADGFRITVYPRGKNWAATVAAVESSDVQHSRRNYKTIAEAKLAAFDHITRIRQY